MREDSLRSIKEKEQISWTNLTEIFRDVKATLTNPQEIPPPPVLVLMKQETWLRRQFPPLLLWHTFQIKLGRIFMKLPWRYKKELFLRRWTFRFTAKNSVAGITPAATDNQKRKGRFTQWAKKNAPCDNYRNTDLPLRKSICFWIAIPTMRKRLRTIRDTKISLMPRRRLTRKTTVRSQSTVYDPTPFGIGFRHLGLGNVKANWKKERNRFHYVRLWKKTAISCENQNTKRKACRSHHLAIGRTWLQLDIVTSYAIGVDLIAIRYDYKLWK